MNSWNLDFFFFGHMNKLFNTARNYLNLKLFDALQSRFNKLNELIN